MGEVVFQVVDTLSIGGAERMAVDVSNGLAGRGWDVHLLATRALGPLASEVDDRVRLHDLARRSRWDLRGLRTFRSLVAREGPAVVHAHGWSSLQFATVGLLGRRRAPGLVLHDHLGRATAPAPGAPRSPGRSRRAAAWVLTDGHVAVDRSLLEPRLRTRRRLTSAVVPNGVPTDRFTVKDDYALGAPPRLVALANLLPPKDHPNLIEAVGRLADAGQVVEVDLIGASADAAYRARCDDEISARGLDEHVHVTGPSQDVAARLATYDVGVLSSDTESGPIALIEYLAAGLPFVVTDVGEIPARLPPDLRAWVVPPSDAVALAATLGEVLALPAPERRRIAAVGVELARAQLSIDRTVASIEAVYGQITRA